MDANEQFDPTTVPDDENGGGVQIATEVFVRQLQQRFAMLVNQIVTENAELRAGLETVMGDRDAAQAKVAALQALLDELRKPTLDIQFDQRPGVAREG